jgi:hypothetical protein
VNIDSRPDLTDRDRETPSLPMFNGAIPLAVDLCRRGFGCAARFDSIDPFANLAALNGRSRRFGASDTVTWADGAATGALYAPSI